MAATAAMMEIYFGPFLEQQGQLTRNLVEVLERLIDQNGLNCFDWKSKMAALDIILKT